MKLLVFTASLLIAMTLFVSAPASASLNLLGKGDAGGQSVCSQAKDSAVCTDRNKSQPLTGPNGLIPKITRLVAYVAGAAAIVVILLSSLRYVTASGDPKNVESAKNTLIGAIIGLAVIVLAQSIIVFVVDRLGS